MAESVIKGLNNDLGAVIQVPDTIWTIPCEGYIRVAVTGPNGRVRVRILGKTDNDNPILLTTVYDTVHSDMGVNSVYVRGGMRAITELFSSTEASCKFIPLI